MWLAFNFLSDGLSVYSLQRPLTHCNNVWMEAKEWEGKTTKSASFASFKMGWIVIFQSACACAWACACHLSSSPLRSALHFSTAITSIYHQSYHRSVSVCCRSHIIHRVFADGTFRNTADLSHSHSVFLWPLSSFCRFELFDFVQVTDHYFSHFVFSCSEKLSRKRRLDCEGNID